MDKFFLEVKNVKTYFPVFKGTFIQKVVNYVKAVDDVSFTIEKGKVLGLVGESGCGKSTLGRSVMQLVNVREGSVIIGGEDVTRLKGKELVKARRKFQMIFQDPYASLNPRMTVFDILKEPLLFHGLATRSNVTEKISQLMEEVGLAARFMKKYPHEFSGGQRQRIAIARALALEPELIIADEPVSALDVSIQSQILNLMVDLCKKRNLTMIFISHDLSVIRHIAQETVVMYLGKIVEHGKTEDVFTNAQHPYTKALLSAIPLPDPLKELERERVILEGDPPSPLNPPAGCRFHPRCSFAKDICKQTIPTTNLVGHRHMVACVLTDEYALKGEAKEDAKRMSQTVEKKHVSFVKEEQKVSDDLFELEFNPEPSAVEEPVNTEEPKKADEKPKVEEKAPVERKTAKEESVSPSEEKKDDPYAEKKKDEKSSGEVDLFSL